MEKRPHTRPKDEGWATITAVVVLAFCLFVSMIVTTLTTTDLVQSTGTTAQTVARDSAEGAAQWFYGEAEAGELTSFTKFTNVNTGLIYSSGWDEFQTTNTVSSSSKASSSSAGPSPTLKLSSCPTSVVPTTTCWRLDVYESQDTTAPNPDKSVSGFSYSGDPVLRVVADGRTDCSGGSTPTNCVEVEVHLRLQQAQFAQYALFDNYQTLDPCLYPALEPATPTNGDSVGSYTFADASTYVSSSSAPVVSACQQWSVSDATNGSSLTSDASTGAPLNQASGFWAASNCDALATSRVEPNNTTYNFTGFTNESSNQYCFPVGYSTSVTTSSAASEQINGPVHTNDDTLFACASSTPVFGSYAEDTANTNGGSAVTATPNQSPCTSDLSSAISEVNANGQDLPLPSPLPAGSGPTESLFTNFYGPLAGSANTIAANGTVELETSSNGTYNWYVYCPPGTKIGSSQCQSEPWPSNGVIFGLGDLYVTGTTCAPVTLAAFQSVYVIPSSSSASSTSLGSGTASGCKGLIGLVAGNGIGLEPPGPAYATSTTITGGIAINADMVALGWQNWGSCSYASGAWSCPDGPGVYPAGTGSCESSSECNNNGFASSVYVVGWDDYLQCSGTSECNCPCTATVDGSIAEQYAGGFGVYTSDDDVASGYPLVLNYDPAFLSSEPPYFVRPLGTAGITPPGEAYPVLWEEVGATTVGSPTS